MMHAELMVRAAEGGRGAEGGEMRQHTADPHTAAGTVTRGVRALRGGHEAYMDRAMRTPWRTGSERWG